MTWRQRWRRDPERGDSAVFVLLIAPVVIILVGLVVDGAGKIQAQEQATVVAQSAARAGVNAGVPADLPPGREITLAPAQAQAAAQAYLGAAGLEGTAVADTQTVTVATSKTYTTKFLSLIGINTLQGYGTGSAQLLSEGP